MPRPPFIHPIPATAHAMAGVLWVCAPGSSMAEPEDHAYSTGILPILERYCYDCHADGLKKGGVTLDSHRDTASLLADRDLWERVRKQIDFRLMPPPDEEAPGDPERAKLLSWIDDAVFPVDPNNPDPGHVTLRRLNRNEYRNTIRDLLGVAPDVDDILPPDDSGYGFATRVIADFAKRAFRRPVTNDEVRRFRELALERAGGDIERGIRDALLAVLVSPSFIYREETGGVASGTGGKSLISEFALASRLS